MRIAGLFCRAYSCYTELHLHAYLTGDNDGESTEEGAEDGREEGAEDGREVEVI